MVCMSLPSSFNQSTDAGRAKGNQRKERADLNENPFLLARGIPISVLSPLSEINKGKTPSM